VTFLNFKRHSTGQKSSELSELSELSDLSELARQAGARRLASLSAFRDWIAPSLLGVFKIAPMANYSELSFKSSEIGTLMTLPLQRSSVLPTRAFS
jgi:hypothetical protein